MVNPTDEEISTHQGSETWYKRVPYLEYTFEQTEKIEARHPDVGR